MDFSLTEDQRRLRETIVRFARAELNEDVPARDRRQEFSRERWRKCAGIGLLGLPVPERYGGSGLDPLSTALALEALGYACHDGGLVFSLCAHVLAGVVPVWKYGSEVQRRRHLPHLCNGESIAVNAMSEPGTGSDAFALRTKARPHDGGFRISGTKTFGTNAPVADLALVFADVDAGEGRPRGLTAFLVERGTRGFSAGPDTEKMGLRTSPLGDLVLEDVLVPADAVLGKVGAGAMLFTHTMNWERACLAAAHIGTMERLLEQALDYARTRRAYGEPIGRFQAVSHKLADVKVELEAARLLTYRAAWRLERDRGVALDAAMAKLFVSESFVRAARDVVQVHGGYGYMAEYQVERALRDALGSTLYSGTSEIQRNIIAGWLGL
jgi:alkylation response protein AidB-like acyl-CoA dehydrogenase